MIYFSGKPEEKKRKGAQRIWPRGWTIITEFDGNATKIRNLNFVILVEMVADLKV